jgi:hypothetical protein
MSVTLRDYSDYARNVASGSVAGIFELSALQRFSEQFRGLTFSF